MLNCEIKKEKNSVNLVQLFKELCACVLNKMCLNLKLTIFVGLILYFMDESNASNSTSTTYFTGLLSDVLQTNREHDLKITQLCNDELNSIQSGLDVKDVWAIKCK